MNRCRFFVDTRTERNETDLPLRGRFTINIWIYQSYSPVVTVIRTITIAASRQDGGKLNDVMMRSRRRLERCTVSLFLSLWLARCRSSIRSSPSIQK